MAIDKSLISGSTSMLIPRLLEDKDMYGYEMIETLEKKIKQRIHPKSRNFIPAFTFFGGKRLPHCI